ncbi:ribonuclease H1-like protein [Basidiobolus meristosporus CBS 931.73]|uniref:ribonuclease H n=1 Tax=Basidiobolus meristosporus CBS 931.73 TaxID=1314790 RepID=A0A1Y1Y3C4_9FUNG|nr:ribonuclease H1-like protein [Basidiobolus meristosporus CBS 931.73]|eukprot:ORX92216.1 ribonuclease H1-like protein [Basidiobolus meristosporus CBS 931.73]
MVVDNIMDFANYVFTAHKSLTYRPECEAQVLGYKYPIYKKFDSQVEAEDFVRFGRKGKPSKISKETECEPDVSDGEYFAIFTDGSSRGNGKAGCRAGVGVYFGQDDPRNVSEPLLGKQTNQRAEIMAAIRAIENAGDDELKLNIKTDSQYLINAITVWIHNWKARQWKTSAGKDVENKDLIQKLDQLITRRPGKVRFTHVKGHSGVPGNEMADMLANAGAELHS